MSASSSFCSWISSSLYHRYEDALLYFIRALSINWQLHWEETVFLLVCERFVLGRLLYRRKSETQTRGFLSEYSCCLLVYWVRIYYSAIFLRYVLQSRREMEREREWGGPSNSTGVRTHWIVWSSWVARLFLAQSNSMALYWLPWWETEASWFIPKAMNLH